MANKSDRDSDSETSEAAPVTPAGVSMKLAGRDVTTIPRTDWRASAWRALRERRIDEWAERVLDEASLKVLAEVDPTLAEIWEMAGSIAAETDD